jgi:hypothetical protein
MFKFEMKLNFLIIKIRNKITDIDIQEKGEVKEIFDNLLEKNKRLNK